MFYSTTTKDEEKPSDGNISVDTLISLAEMDDYHKVLALDLIKGLLPFKDEIQLEVATLLYHPLFTIYIDEAKSRLIESLLEDDKKMSFICNEEELEKFEKVLDKNKGSHINFDNEDFGDLRDAVWLILTITQLL